MKYWFGIDGRNLKGQSLKRPNIVKIKEEFSLKLKRPNGFKKGQIYFGLSKIGAKVPLPALK